MTNPSSLVPPAPVETPCARIIPHQLKAHGQVRVDNYYWLNDRSNSEVIAYLQKENEYAKAQSQHTADFERQLIRRNQRAY